MTGEVVTITRFRMAQDGEGVSTLVTLFGCPLHCQCCANAFCNEKETPVTYYTPEHLCETLKIDDLYFKMTGGGIVFGGGEPLMQSKFVQDVCRLADPMWKKRIETSLHVKWGDIAPLTDIIDEWIIDVKDMNPEIYKRYTGSSNWLVIRNLKKLADAVPKEKIWLRVPLIDGINTKDDVKKSVAALKEMGFNRIEEFKYIDIHSTIHKPKNIVKLPRIPRQGYGMMLVSDEARLASLSGSREVKRFDEKYYKLLHQLHINELEKMFFKKQVDE